MSLQFTSLQREIDNRNLDIGKLKVEQQKLHGVIKALEKDIMGLKREIQERDETIQNKVEPEHERDQLTDQLVSVKYPL